MAAGAREGVSATVGGSVYGYGADVTVDTHGNMTGGLVQPENAIEDGDVSLSESGRLQVGPFFFTPGGDVGVGTSVGKGPVSVDTNAKLNVFDAVEGMVNNVANLVVPGIKMVVDHVFERMNWDPNTDLPKPDQSNLPAQCVKTPDPWDAGRD
jgi:hypothetical protein